MNLSRLPEKPVKAALVSGEYPGLAEGLERRGVTPIKTLFDERLPAPVGCHPDMQACLLGDETILLRDSPLRDKLAAWGLPSKGTKAAPLPSYPGDVLCNGFIWGGRLVGNPQTLDAAVLESARRQGLEILPVRQGYASCSVAVLDGKSAITADAGMAKQLGRAGFEILPIRPGFIVLPGYDTGFIGGCCGLLASGLLAVSGKLESHPDGDRIRAFIHSRNISIIELAQGPLLDVGGILPLA